MTCVKTEVFVQIVRDSYSRPKEYLFPDEAINHLFATPFSLNTRCWIQNHL